MKFKNFFNFFYLGLLASLFLSACKDSTGDPITSSRDGGRGVVLESSIKHELLSPLDLPAHNSRPKIQVSGIETGQTIRVFRDSKCQILVASKKASSTSETIKVSSLPSGKNTLYVRVSDSIGNLSPCSEKSVKYTWYADRISLELLGEAEIPADEIAKTTFKAVARDENNLPAQNEKLTFLLGSNTGSIDHKNLYTDENGIAVFNLTSSLNIGTHSYQVQSAHALSSLEDVEFLDPASLYFIELSIEGKNQLIADTQDTTTLKAQVLNGWNQPVQNHQLFLNIQDNGGSSVNSISQTTNGEGIASWDIISSTLAGNYTYNVDNGFDISNDVYLSFKAGPIDQLNFTLNGPNQLIANKESTTIFKAIARDEFGNKAKNRNIILHIPENGGSTLNPQKTNSKGEATWTLTSSFKAGNYSYFVSSEGINSPSLQVEFKAGPVYSLLFELTGDNELSADGPSQTSFKATAKDQFGNVVPQKDLTLVIPSQAGTTQNPQTTDVNGEAQWILNAGNKAGNFSYKARFGQINSSSKNITITPGELSQIDLTVTGEKQINVGGDQTELKAQALDAHLNAIKNISLTLNIPANGGDSEPLGAITTNQEGKAIWQITSGTVAGQFEFTATDSNLNSNPVAVIFNALEPESLNLSISGNQEIIANGQSTTSFDVEVLDIYQNPVKNVEVELFIEENGGQGNSPQQTNSNGIANITLISSEKAGSYSYHAFYNEKQSNDQTVDFVAGPVSLIDLIITGPSEMEVGGEQTTFEVVTSDAFGNLTEQAEVTINLPPGSGSAFINPTYTNSEGKANFTIESGQQAGTYEITVSADGATSNSQEITLNSRDINSIDLEILDSTEIIADGASTTRLKATALDEFSNPIKNQHLSLLIPQDGGTTDATNLQTDENGEIQWILTSSTKAATYQYQVTNQQGVNSDPIDVTFIAGPIHSLDFILSGDHSIEADGSSQTTFTSIAKDIHENVIEDQSIFFIIPPNGGNVIEGNPSQTNSNGEVIWTLESSTTAGTYHYLVTSENVDSTSEDITFLPGNLASLELNHQENTQIIANGVSTTSLLAIAKDGHNNTISNLNLTLSIPPDGGSTINPRVTNENGEATWTLTSSSKAGNYTYQVIKDSIQSNTQDVEFIPGQAHSLTLATLGASNIVADETSQSILQATLLDMNNNPIENEEITLNLPSNGGTASQNPITTNSSGEAQWIITSSTKAGIYNYLATNGTLDSNIKSLQFEAGPVDVITLVIDGPPEITADGVNTTTLKSTAQDENGNPVTDINLTLSLPINGGSLSGGNPKKTNSLGEVFWTITSSTTPGQYDYDVSHNTTISNQVSLKFISGEVSTLLLSLTGNQSITADGNSLTTLEAQALDSQNNPIEDVELTLNIPQNGGDATNPQTTNSLGIANWNLTSSTKAGIYEYKVSDGINDSNSVSIFFEAGDLNEIEITNTGSEALVADGISSTTIQALAIDEYNNPISNLALHLNLPANGGSTTNPRITNSQGVANWILTSGTVTGNYQYNVSKNGISSNNLQLDFISGDVDSIEFNITGASVITANESDQTTLEAIAYDSFSNPIEGVALLLNIPTNGGDVLELNPQQTDSNGMVQWSLTSSTNASDYSYSVSYNFINSPSKSLQFEAGDIDSVILSLLGDDQIPADAQSSTFIQALVQDEYLNPISNATVSLNIPPHGGSSNPNTTNINGITNLSLTSSLTPGEYEYTAESSMVISDNSIFIDFKTAELLWDLDNFDFGNGGVAETRTFILSNVGLLESGQISIDLETDYPDEWFIITDNCQPSVTLDPTDSCTVIIEYRGDEGPHGLHTATLKATSSPGGEEEVQLQGETPE